MLLQAQMTLCYICIGELAGLSRSVVRCGRAVLHRVRRLPNPGAAAKREAESPQCRTYLPTCLTLRLERLASCLRHNHYTTFAI